VSVSIVEYNKVLDKLMEASAEARALSRKNGVGPDLHPYALTRAIGYLHEAELWFRESKNRSTVK
jgi:hypothetical protein